MPIVIPRREIWTRQPQQAARIDWSNPLANGLVFASPDSQWDVVQNQRPINTGLSSRGINRFGIYPIFGTSNYCDFPKKPKITPTTPATVLWVQEPRSTSAYSTVLELQVGTAGVNNTFVVYESSTDASYYFVSGPRSGSSFPCSLWGGVGALTNSEVTVRAVSSLSGLLSTTLSDWAAYKNGIALTRTGTSILSSYTGDTFRVGARDSGSDPFEGLIGPVFIWGRVLSAYEVASLSENPWQIFQP